MLLVNCVLVFMAAVTTVLRLLIPVSVFSPVTHAVWPPEGIDGDVGGRDGDVRGRDGEVRGTEDWEGTD